MHELLRFTLQQPTHWNPGPLAHEFGDVFFIHLFFEHGRIFLYRREALLCLFEFLFRRRNFSVADFRHLGQLARPLVLLLLSLELLDLLFQLTDARDGFLLRLPARLPGARFLAQLRQFCLDLLAALDGMRVRLLQ